MESVFVEIRGNVSRRSPPSLSADRQGGDDRGRGDFVYSTLTLSLICTNIPSYVQKGVIHKLFCV